ncbi:MAG: hypothetical protein PBU42_03900 [Acinetobacter haemolyticus]
MSEAGDKIIVEQIYEEKLIETDLTLGERLWCPISKIVIVDKVIDLSEDNTFTHPRTGKIFSLS